MPLALTIKEDEEITIGPDVSMRFHPDYEHSRGRLRWRICIDAPPEIEILRRPAVPLPEGAGLVLVPNESERPTERPSRMSVVVNAALIRLAKAWERWDDGKDCDKAAADRELEEARDVVRRMGVLECK